MANLRDLNQTNQNPFWEWVADLEKQSRTGSENGEGSSSQRTTPGRQDKQHDDNLDKGDDMLPDFDEKMPPPPPFDGHPPPEFDDPPSPPPPPSHPEPHHPHFPGGDRGRHHHRGGFGRRGGHEHHRGGHHAGPWQHGFAGWRGGPPTWGGPFGGRRGGCRRGRGGPLEELFGKGGFDMEKLGQMLKDNLGFDPLGNTRNTQDDKEFTPAIDVFNTPQAFFIHISLAGAKKEDLDVSWDAENFQVIVRGIIHRPGDEEFLKTIAVDERDIGLFERKIKLGTRADPINVDADGISARMEDGVLMIRAPKVEEFIEIKKVDID